MQRKAILTIHCNHDEREQAWVHFEATFDPPLTPGENSMVQYTINEIKRRNVEDAVKSVGVGGVLIGRNAERKDDPPEPENVFYMPGSGEEV